jgi:hypothetical protein
MPSVEELAEAELRARLALHGIKADLGEEILYAQRRHDVNVAARVDSEARREEIANALAGIAHLSVDVQTYSEAAPRGADATGEKDSREPGRITLETATSMPQLADLLARLLPDEKSRIAFVNDTLAQSQVALDHAFAIGRLASRYSAQETALLDGRGKQALGMLLAGHCDSMGQALFALDRAVGKLQGSKQMFSSKIEGSDWRPASGELRRSVVEMHQALRGALAGNAGPDIVPSAEELVGGLKTKLGASRVRLDALREALLQEFTH